MKSKKENQIKTEYKEELIVDESAVTLIESKKDKKRNEKEQEVCFDAFYYFSKLLNKPISTVIDECCLYELNALMRKMGKVIVRYNVTDKELQNIIAYCNKLHVSEMLISPAYLSTILRISKKQPFTDTVLSVLVDFPFGESLFKSKLTEVKNCVKTGVKEVTVMMPSMSLDGENAKTFKKQVKKLGKLRGVNMGIALSAMDLKDKVLSSAIHVIEKTKVKFITLVFGEISESELEEKMNIVNASRGKKQIKILANVSKIESVQKLIAKNVDEIYTPFADDIGREILDKFNIKN